ncbi:GTPase IMAP family member 8-like [Rhinichthys klamathensis goyatoka]|uniref:GTPase IMAP family member 8-like n=1 Tax=Rhinichthys klamathensis goyatoka TaxID=3034132 RepID=UPI0024B5BD95|nr:GTPase IMAP family member 8-like [Rhinichthys klamathensis goyatoka]
MSAPGPHVFLLVIRLNGRYTESEKNTVKWIQEKFGEEAVHHTFVLFTHVDLLMGESLDQYIRKSPDLQLVIDNCGGKFYSFNNQDRSNQNQATELLEKIEQLVKDNRGDHYANEKRKKKQEEPRQDNSKEDTESDLDELRKETDELMNLMMRLELSKMALRLSLARAMAHSNLSRQDLRIVLLGFLGAGKSSTGNTILGRDVFRASLRTTTRSCEKQAAVVFGRMVSITDTPGLIDLFRKNKDLKSVIDSCGGRYHTLNNKDRSNQGQVTELLQKIDEMVQRNGGKHYTRQNIFKRQDDTSGCKIQ